MGFFKRRKDRVLDLTKQYEKQQARAAPQAYPETFPTEMSTRGKDMQESNSSSENVGGLGFFGAIANTVSQNNSNNQLAPEGVPPDMQDGIFGGNVSSGVDEKKRKLAKRLIEMTNKIEELSNQIYHLQQRIEVLEKKSGVGSY